MKSVGGVPSAASRDARLEDGHVNSRWCLRVGSACYEGITGHGRECLREELIRSHASRMDAVDQSKTKVLIPLTSRKPRVLACRDLELREVYAGADGAQHNARSQRLVERGPSARYAPIWHGQSAHSRPI